MYQLHSAGDLTKKDFEGRIFWYLLNNYKRYHVFFGNHDQWGDFLSWLYPRLARAIDLYKEQGSSFDAYINSLIHCASKEYRSRETDHHITEYTCWQAKVEEMRLFESEAEYLDGCTKSSPIPKGVKPRQILFLLLKSYCYANDDVVERTAHAIGMNTELIWEMIDELRKLRSVKDDEILNLRERLYCQYYRCLAYQNRMIGIQPGTEYHRRMKDRFERAKKRLNTMKKRIGGVRMGATNRMIADVLGIPKGTVDSALYVVKNRMVSG